MLMDNEELIDDIRVALNKNSVDAVLSTPDYILAERLVRLLDSERQMQSAINDWKSS